MSAESAAVRCPSSRLRARVGTYPWSGVAASLDAHGVGVHRSAVAKTRHFNVIAVGGWYSRWATD